MKVNSDVFLTAPARKFLLIFELQHAELKIDRFLHAPRTLDIIAREANMDPLSKANLSQSRERSNANLIPFKPGQSGNPGGRKKKTEIERLQEDAANDPEYAKKFVEAQKKRALLSNMAGVLEAREMQNRTQGPVAQVLEVSNVNLTKAEIDIKIAKLLTGTHGIESGPSEPRTED